MSEKNQLISLLKPDDVIHTLINLAKDYDAWEPSIGVARNGRMENVYSCSDSILDSPEKNVYFLIYIRSVPRRRQLTHRSILSTGLGGHVDMRFFDQHFDGV